MTTRGHSPSSPSPEIVPMQPPANDEDDTNDNEMDGINGIGNNNDLEDSKQDTVETRRQNSSDINKNRHEPGSQDSPWMQNMFTRIYQDLRTLSKDFHVPITVPELLFFGFQSSGKTSTLSILAKTPAGTMQDGTGTRCPVRYTLTYNEEYYKPRLTVGGLEVFSFEEQTLAICKHMQALEDNSGSKFTADILEATIESRDVPNLIFVDMPGLIKKSNEEKYRDWKEQLETITGELLTRRTADGESFAFIPIFVREAFDVENDDGYEIKTISRLCGNKRPHWRDDTLFIINKFDTKGNRRSAQSFVDYISQLINEGETVITVANPGGARVQAMKPNELVEHIKSVPHKEERWWRELIGDFRRKADPWVNQLEDTKSEFCGVPLMEQILVDKMCYIVKNTLPLLQTQLERREQEYRDYIAKLQKDMDLDDPSKLKQRVSEFNHKFLEALREFYQGRDLASVRDFRETWVQDMDNFRNPKYFKTIHQNAQDWDRGSDGAGFGGFYIEPYELEDELSSMDRLDLVHMSRSGLLGGVAVRRALDLWVAMISLMPFPDYTHEDILNFGDPFAGTIQGDPWIIIRNVVYHASIQLRKGCIWFGEYLRYRLKTNAEIVFKTCLAEQFGNTVKPFGRGHGNKYGNNDFGGLAVAQRQQRNIRIGMNQNNPGRNRNNKRRQGRNKRSKLGGGGSNTVAKSDNIDSRKNLDGPLVRKGNKSSQDMERLLEIGLTDYKKLVDIMVNEFQEAVEVIPADQSEILDRKFHEDIMNLSELLQTLLDQDDNGCLIDREASVMEHVADTKNSRGKEKKLLKSNDERTHEAIKMRRAQETFESQSTTIQSKQMIVTQANDSVNLATTTNNNNSKPESINDMLEDPGDDDPFAAEDNNNNNTQEESKLNYEPINVNKSLKSGRQHMLERDRKIRHPYTRALRESRDRNFYKTLYPRQSKRLYHHMTERSTFLILKLSKVVWTCIKKHVITTAQQTLTNRVLAELKQHGERCQNALLIGIDYPHIQELVSQLEDKTKIPKADIEKMIESEKKIELSKGVGQMDNDEIRKVYGSNIKELQEEYTQMVQEYNAFLKKKEEIQVKIKELQDMDLTEDID